MRFTRRPVGQPIPTKAEQGDGYIRFTWNNVDDPTIKGYLGSLTAEGLEVRPVYKRRRLRNLWRDHR